MTKTFNEYLNEAVTSPKSNKFYETMFDDPNTMLLVQKKWNRFGDRKLNQLSYYSFKSLCDYSQANNDFLLKIAPLTEGQSIGKFVTVLMTDENYVCPGSAASDAMKSIGRNTNICQAIKYIDNLNRMSWNETATKKEADKWLESSNFIILSDPDLAGKRFWKTILDNESKLDSWWKNYLKKIRAKAKEIKEIETRCKKLGII